MQWHRQTSLAEKTLEILKLTKMHKTVIHKNTPSVNGMLASIKELIKVQPIVFRTDIENSPNGGQFLTDNAEFFIEEKELADLIENHKNEHETFKQESVQSA